MRFWIWSFGYQGIGCSGTSAARREYGLSQHSACRDTHSSLLAAATEVPLQPIPLALVVASGSWLDATRCLLCLFQTLPKRDPADA
ncbi:MAG: hypothetical protein P8P26_07940 [Porticoccaceae bacterium]|nr:hypothetical protein [Porticoccaceae bacterium]